jgi:prolyl-tRNA synthetase
MRYSKLFGKSIRAVSKEIQSKGYEYLLKGGFLRESSSGRFYLLPLGIRVHEKICRVLEEELSAIGAQKMLAPVLHPKELWQETNRTESVSFELMQVQDRNKRSFVLGGTAEEMMVALVRQFSLSERDLPFCIYQLSTKFRDELRARGGMLRAREFTMKDAYSFHKDKEDFENYYRSVQLCYERIFKRLDIPAVMVAADNGYMGGDYCHEFIVEHELGESYYLTSTDGNYVAHQDIATFRREHCNPEEKILPLKVDHAVRGTTIQAGIELYGQPAWRQIKSILYFTETNEPILACLRGDLSISESKVINKLRCATLRLATEAEVQALGSIVGFVSPLKLKVRKIGDLSLTSVNNFYTGADEWHKDTLNVNYGRDFSVDILDDIAEAQEGYCSVETGSPLQLKRGIEVGNIFQLGTWYSGKMKGAEFTSKEGEKLPYYMGCYGIGIGRTMATIAETHFDDKGLCWPEASSPFDIHLIVLGNDKAVINKAEEWYSTLVREGKSVLFDDREVSAGIKFSDADLIGIPSRMVISQRTLESGVVERSLRSANMK